MSRAIDVASIRLPSSDGRVVEHILREPIVFPKPARPLQSRTFFAAAHVVCDPLHEPDGSDRARLDWDATMAYRHLLWSYGLGVADAMDTSQRGMGLDWRAAQELIRRSAREARAVGGRLACGAGTDQLPPGPASLSEIEDAYLEQCAFVEEQGADVIVMASRALAAGGDGARDYHRVYGTLIERAARPVILHWLGEMFDPALAGYWGSRDLATASDTVIELVSAHVDKIDGIKVSLLDPAQEVALRRRLPPGIHLYTGDDLNYTDLILGDDEGASDALLGIFDAIAPVASAALQALDAGEPERFRWLLEPTVPLARHIFSAPTYHYKTGVVFLAYLNGHQEHFRMVGGLESARSITHLAETFVLADRAGLLLDPGLATVRMRQLLGAAGVDA